MSVSSTCDSPSHAHMLESLRVAFLDPCADPLGILLLADMTFVAATAEPVEQARWVHLTLGSP